MNYAMSLEPNVTKITKFLIEQELDAVRRDQVPKV